MKKLWKKLKTALRSLFHRHSGSGASDTASSPASSSSSSSPDAVPYSSLSWKWGGLDASRATLADGARIRSLKVSGDGLSYSWETGGCEKLGASSSTDASCIACLFCRIGGKWLGGKFDWISTSRRTRDLKNVASGYNGWDKSAVSRADAYAFVIVSKDGRRRTNVAAQGA